MCTALEMYADATFDFVKLDSEVKMTCRWRITKLAESDVR